MFLYQPGGFSGFMGSSTGFMGSSNTRPVQLPRVTWIQHSSLSWSRQFAPMASSSCASFARGAVGALILGVVVRSGAGCAEVPWAKEVWRRWILFFFHIPKRDTGHGTAMSDCQEEKRPGFNGSAMAVPWSVWEWHMALYE